MKLIGLDGEGSGSLGLVPNGSRNVKPIPANILALVPKPTDNLKVYKGSTPDPVRDTVPLIKKLVKRQLWQGKKLADHLKGNSIEQTAKNFWDFIFTYVQYKQDGEDEVIRSLRRLIHEAKAGGDCDCFTTALSNLLLNASIPHFLRVAAYRNSKDYSHIYIVIPKNRNMLTDNNGNMIEKNYITMDCVPHQFNYEVPFTKHKDFAMQLVALDGLDCACGCQGKKEHTPNRITTMVSSKELQQMGFVESSKVLDDAGIAHTKSSEALLITVTAPSGDQVNVPEFIPISKQDKLVRDIQAYTAPTNTSSETTAKSETPKAVAAGGTLLGLLAFVLGVGALRSNPAGKSLSGTPGPKQKKMDVLHM